MSRTDAIVLLGPTGSGKTPLGDLIETRGLWGRRCAHFDFGAQLRAAARGDPAAGGLCGADVAIVRDALRTGALLEDGQFHIAEAILRSFLGRRITGDADALVLNGLPRHAGQARDLEGLVRVVAVVSLVCSPDVIIPRIRRDVGGDRAGRDDDDAHAVRRRLEIYAARTAPLVEHYRAAGARVYEVRVAADTTAVDAWAALSAMPPPGGDDRRGATGRY